MEKFKALSPGQITEVKIHLGVNCIEALIKMRPEMQASADALFGSVVMESWTAFECLAADLWVIVVNNGPAKFRQDVLASKYLKNGKSTSSKGEKASSIDPGKDFAGGLREQGRVSFQTLWNIQNYYEIICGKAKGKEIFALCDSYLTRHRLRPTRWKGEEGRGLRGARCRS